MPTETWTIFIASPGGFTAVQFSPVRLSWRTPVRTIALPLFKTAHTKPVGPSLEQKKVSNRKKNLDIIEIVHLPTLICDISQPDGTLMAFHLCPSGEYLLTPVLYMT